MLNLFLENFVLIFVAIDPITILPIFATFTQGLNKKDLITLCLRSTLTAFGILLVFWLFGSALLQMMGININSFRIVGGDDTQFGGHPWMVSYKLVKFRDRQIFYLVYLRLIIT